MAASALAARLDKVRPICDEIVRKIASQWQSDLGQAPRSMWAASSHPLELLLILEGQLYPWVW